MTSDARQTTIKQRDRALRRVRAATAVAALGAAVGGSILALELASPATSATSTVSTTTSGTSSTTAAPASSTTTSQGAAATSGGS